MTRVANHINEMQRVSDTYCSLFDAILSENAATVQVSQQREVKIGHNVYTVHDMMYGVYTSVIFVLKKCLGSLMNHISKRGPKFFSLSPYSKCWGLTYLM